MLILDLDFFPSRIPDPGVKKAFDHGSRIYDLQDTDSTERMQDQ
jgi:hypothetical protein